MPRPLQRVPRGTQSGAGRLVLPAWLTPAFAKRKLRSGKLAKRPQRGEAYSQADRYRAISEGQDWDRSRDWTLVWQEPRQSGNNS
jgi:hypothetical protein